MKHLDQKYFTYRASKVDAASTRYPQRAAVLAASEYLRLGFVAVGSLLCAAIFGILAITAVPRIGWLDWRTFVFTALTAMPAAIFLRAALSFLSAIKIRAAGT